MTKLAYLISKMEGFGIPGTIPTLRNNPGDLRHGPHCQHPPGDPNAVGTIDTAEHGWEDLERQLQIYASEGFTVQETIYVYLGVPMDATPVQVADAPDRNDVMDYLNYVLRGLNMTGDTKMVDALKVQV